MRIEIPFIGGAYTHRHLNIDAQQCINLYPEITDSGTAKAQKVLLGTPGLTESRNLFSTNELQVTSPRQKSAYKASDGNSYFVSGGQLYRVSTFRFADDYYDIPFGFDGEGALSTTTGPVYMADNGTILMIVDGTYYYKYVFATETFSVISDAALTTGASHISYIDGFFIVNDVGTNKWRSSPINWNGTDAWDSLAIGYANQGPDEITALAVSGRDIALLGPQTAEVWYDAGSTPFPFGRNTSVSFQVGIAAPHSLARLKNNLIWLGSGEDGRGQIVMLSGFQLQRISTFCIESEIEGYADISDAFSFTYQRGGHFFYVLIFPAENKSWVFDLATGEWHEWLYLNPDTGLFERCLPVLVCEYQDELYALSRVKEIIPTITFTSTGMAYGHNVPSYSFYKLDPYGYKDGDDYVRRVRSTPHISDNGKRVFYGNLQVDMNTGDGLVTGQGSDPQAVLRISNDGGKTYGYPMQAGIGALGNYNTRLRWNRLGSGRDRVFELSISDPIPVAITGAWADVTAGE